MTYHQALPSIWNSWLWSTGTDTTLVWSDGIILVFKISWGYEAKTKTYMLWSYRKAFVGTGILCSSNMCIFKCLHEPYLPYDVAMPVAGSQVQWRVISTVHDIDASASHDEHVHHTGTALPACPMERTEAVVISMEKRAFIFSTSCTKAFSKAENNSASKKTAQVFLEGDKSKLTTSAPWVII